ncbi:hypothetical protein QJQ45_020684, partial [Haematococcus lacustris]
NKVWGHVIDLLAVAAGRLRMQLQSAQRSGTKASIRPARSISVLKPQRCQAVQAWKQEIGAVLLAASLVISAPAMAEAQPRMLSDLARGDYSFVDVNGNGIIDQEEINNLAKQVAQEEGFVAPDEEVVAFTTRLFDLNQDGKLVVDELLTGIVLENAVDRDEVTVPEDVFKVFDQDGDGFVSRKEWTAPLGDLGVNGEAMKDFVFDRVQYLQRQDGKLDVAETRNALSLLRVAVLGY